MTIGDSFPHAVPAVGAAGTQYATDVNKVLGELIGRTSVPIPFSALAGGALNMSNVPIQNAQYVGLYSQASSPGASPVNRFEAYLGEVYWVNSSGALKITNAGTINAAGIGGIGGNYGGVNPALVTFIDASNRYDFYDDFGGVVWAKVRAGGVDIAATGTSGTGTAITYAQLRFAGVSTLTFVLPATLPSSNRSVVLINNTGELFHNNSTNTVENDIVLASTTKIQHGSREVLADITNCFQVAGGGSISRGTSGDITVAGVGSLTVFVPITPQVGWTITGVKIRTVKSTTGTTSVGLKSYADATLTTGGSLGSDTTIGTRTISHTFATPLTVATLTRTFLEVLMPVNGDVLYSVSYIYQQNA